MFIELPGISSKVFDKIKQFFGCFKIFKSDCIFLCSCKSSCCREKNIILMWQKKISENYELDYLMEKDKISYINYMSI